MVKLNILSDEEASLAVAVAQYEFAIPAWPTLTI
jgi:hypothetical protein